jgi:hypothetical protein
MTESQREVLQLYQREVENLVGEIDVYSEGEHLWENYQKVTATVIRLNEIRNEIANYEIMGTDFPELKKFRTLIIDPTKDMLEKVAAFESRKITARQMEIELEKR